jgi:NAD-dependent deacetylase
VERLPAALRDRLAGVRSVGVVTGAGISKAAGLPTYRGRGGVYEDPVEGDRTIEALTGSTFRRDPERTWERILRLARGAAAASPGPAHQALVDLERRVGHFVLLTQNVDGLHARAGSRHVIEIHGNVLRVRCLDCGTVGPLEPEALVPGAPRPPCFACGGLVRPDVVLFEEALPTPELTQLHAELLARSPDLVLLVGTSALFPYIVEPAARATRRGCVSVEINPEPTEASRHVRYTLRGSAEDWLPELLAALPRSAD